MSKVLVIDKCDDCADCHLFVNFKDADSLIHDDCPLDDAGYLVSEEVTEKIKEFARTIDFWGEYHTYGLGEEILALVETEFHSLTGKDEK